ncbi:coiled-coil domain-containing protein 142 isoform X2 [Dendropsophus ebraccatus]|uniref:coiled-coil domain-containing protein 142 isoform X2 n=1 Tax=Dendropsophus ebraccatus TaxID=150705 RepID=UPI0038313C12
MRRREPSWSDYRHGSLQGSASSSHSSVLLQGAPLRCDVISEGEELTHSTAGRQNAALLSLCRQRQLLTLVREFVVHQMQVMEYYQMLEHTPVSGLEVVCLKLQELCRREVVLQKRVRSNQLLPLLSPLVHRTLGHLHTTLQLMSVKAAIVTEELVLGTVRRMARLPAEIPASLCRTLTIYNKVIGDMSQWAAAWTNVRPMSITNFLEIMAEERGWLLARHFSMSKLGHRLEDVLNGEVESQEVDEALSSCLKTLIWEDQGQTAPLLKQLVGLDHMMRSGLEGHNQDSAESLLYNQYCSRLWPILCAHLYQALYPGRWGARAMPALAPCVVGARSAAAIQLLLSTLTSDAVPEPCREQGHSLCHNLLCTAAFISWDRGTCRALSLALTDKCVTLLLDDGTRRTHSRTAAALVSVCQEVSVLLHAMSSGDISTHRAVLSRSVTTMQLCNLWLRSRSQIYTSSGSLGQLLLISHGDMPVIKDQMCNVTSAAHNVEWHPESRQLCEKLETTAESLEGVALCLPRLVASVCSHQARDIFQNAMPVGRHWRGKVASGPDLVPSEYAQAAVNTVLAPALEGMRNLSPEEQISAVSNTVGVFMEAWMEHILRERLKFSLQGALQLRCDFEVVRELLKSQEMSPEVFQATLSLPVFQQADNAIVCLLQQPSRKAYLQSRGCFILCCPLLCRTAVENVSDSLQSLDSLGRRVWSHNYPAHRPRHSHDSYLPHNQRQWLSLRLHKNWNGLG